MVGPVRFEVSRQFHGFASKVWSRETVLLRTRHQWLALLVFRHARRFRRTPNGTYVYRLRVVGRGE